jgi:hypothetical protein
MASHTVREPMASKRPEEKRPNRSPHGLTVVLDLTGGRTFIIERPHTEIAAALAEILRGDDEQAGGR